MERLLTSLLPVIVAVFVLLLSTHCQFQKGPNEEDVNTGSSAHNLLREQIPPSLLEKCILSANNAELKSQCALLVNSLFQDSVPFKYYTDRIEIIDSSIVRWSFASVDGIPHFDSHFMLELVITDSGYIKAKDGTVSGVKEIGHLIEKYRESSKEYDSIDTKNVKSFSEISLPREGYLIQVEVSEPSLSTTKCETLINMLKQIRYLYELEREDIAMEIWKKSFDSLSIRQKVIATETTNLRTTVVIKS